MTADAGWPEPTPDWADVAVKLDWLWPLHRYFFASVFALLAIVALVTLFLTKSLQHKRFMETTMIAAVFVLAISRSSLLFADPARYRTTGSFPLLVFCVIISGLGTTCLTASLTILLFITAVSVQIAEADKKIHLKRLAFVVTLSDFLYLVISDLVVAFQPVAKIMLTICQVTFSVWGIMVSLGFAILSWKIRRNAHAGFQQEASNPQMRQENAKLRRLGLFMVVLSVNSIALFVVKIKEALEHNEIESQIFSNTWVWLGLQTASRFLEIIIAVILLLVFKKTLGSRHQYDISTQKLRCWNNVQQVDQEVTEN